MNANEIINKLVPTAAETLDGQTVAAHTAKMAVEIQKMLDAIPELLDKVAPQELASQAESTVMMIARAEWDGKNELCYYGINSNGQRSITQLDARQIAILVAAHVYGDPRADYADLVAKATEKGYQVGWAYYRLADKYGKDVAEIVCR